MMSHVRRKVNMTSKICLKIYEEHVVERSKVLLVESGNKTRSPNPVFLEPQRKDMIWCEFIHMSTHMDMYVYTCMYI